MPVQELGPQFQFASWRVPQFPRAIEYPLEVMEEIRAFSCNELLQLSHGGNEVGGVLFGTRRDGLIRILTWRPIACEHAQGPGLRLSYNDRMNLAVQLEVARQNPDLKDLRPVGWLVAHTRGSVSLSPSDLEIYNSFCPEEWQVTLVICPKGGGGAQAGFFVREAEDKVMSEASYQCFDLEPLVLGPIGSTPALRVPVAEPLDLAPSKPPAPAMQPAPSVQTVPSSQPAPAVQPSPVMQPVPGEEPVPSAPPAQIQQFPSVETAPILTPTAPPEPIAQPAPTPQMAPIVEPSRVTRPLPTAQPSATVQPAPSVEPMPTAEPAPTVPPAPLVEPVPLVQPVQTGSLEQLPPARAVGRVRPMDAPPKQEVPAPFIPSPSFEMDERVPTHERWLWVIPILLALGIAAFLLYQRRTPSPRIHRASRVW